jgi:biotin synthase
LSDNTIDLLERSVAERGRIGSGEALALLEDRSLELSALLSLTDRVRRAHKGRRVRLCAIVNARSGACTEDCSFCAQSAHFRTGVKAYPLLEPEKLDAAAREALRAGAGEFSIVTSGPSVRQEREVAALEEALRRISGSAASLQRCASLGRVDRETLSRLRDAGLQCFHHNIETSRDFFPSVCTTHSYEERVEMVRAAKSLGLRVCSGGIFGLGETPADRVALAFTLEELGVDSVPLNFLNPIPGTPLEGSHRLSPVDCLRIVAMFRLVLPERDIVICGGREVNLRDLQSMLFWAGANGLLIGNYLTTGGRPAEEDLKMVADLGLEPYLAGADGPEAA